MMLYATERGRLAGMQDVTGWEPAEINELLGLLQEFGRRGEVSAMGRGVCSVCRLDLGPRDIPAGMLSHGLCGPCAAEFQKQIAAR